MGSKTEKSCLPRHRGAVEAAATEQLADMHGCGKAAWERTRTGRPDLRPERAAVKTREGRCHQPVTELRVSRGGAKGCGKPGAAAGSFCALFFLLSFDSAEN